MAILTPIILIIGTVLAAVFLFFKKKFRYWDDLGFIHTQPSFPMGDAKGLGSGKNLGLIINQIYKDHPKERFVGFWMLFRPSLLIRDPELVKQVFVKDFMSFHDRGIYINEKDDPLAAHLFTIGGTKWRTLRVKMTPTFTSGKMKMMYPILANCGEQLKDILEKPASRGEVLEVRDFVARFSTDIISLCAFGIETNSIKDPDSDFRHFGQKVFDPTWNNTLRGFIQFLVPDLAKLLSLVVLDKECTKFFLKAVRETMDYREENNVRRNDFMDLLIQLKTKGKLEGVDEANNDTNDLRKFTFEEAAAQAFVFFIAGFETSSTTMQFALYELAKNSELQKKTREEINKVMAKHNNEMTYECIMDMEYLGRVIDETLRVYPPVPFLQRECNKDYLIPGSKNILPKGTNVVIDVIGLQHDPLHFPNPDVFDPERFTEGEKAKRHHYAYLPFGEGPRNCIGMRFGLMQTKVGLVTLLRNYEFNVATETLIPMVFDPHQFILQPKGGMHLKITKV